MPNYDYRCPDCGHEYTKFQKITDESRPACSECGSPGERVISGGAGLIFKGSGFYITDYRSDDYKKKASSEASPSKDTGSKDAGSKDTAKSDSPSSASSD